MHAPLYPSPNCTYGPHSIITAPCHAASMHHRCVEWFSAGYCYCCYPHRTPCRSDLRHHPNNSPHFISYSHSAWIFLIFASAISPPSGPSRQDWMPVGPHDSSPSRIPFDRQYILREAFVRVDNGPWATRSNQLKNFYIASHIHKEFIHVVFCCREKREPSWLSVIPGRTVKIFVSLATIGHDGCDCTESYGTLARG